MVWKLFFQIDRRNYSVGYGNDKTQIIPLPQGSIKKLIGRELSWSDEPVELKEE